MSGATPSDFRDNSHRLHGRRVSLAQEKQRCARSKLIYCCYRNACTQSSALVVIIELRATAYYCFFFVMMA